MMAATPMFWRIIRRLLTANYGRLFVILLALGAGAAVTSALLNLQIDAKKRLTTEFRALGANVIVAPHSSEQTATLPESVFAQIPENHVGGRVAKAAFLYVVAQGTALSREGKEIPESKAPVVVVGFRYVADSLSQLLPYRTIPAQAVVLDADTCDIGEKVASEFHVRVGDALELRTEKARWACVVSEIRAFGGAEDSHVFLPLADAQGLSGLQGQISLVQASVPGTPAQIDSYIKGLGKELPIADVHGIKQFTEAEGHIYDRISGILSATVLLVLFLTSLCVMAGMSNVAVERKNDVGLMKAIGGSVEKVVHLFLTEAVLLGIAGGLVGSAIGLIISIWLGKAVFGVAAQPRLIVYPISVALTIITSIASAFPVRRLASVRPASVFRGEE
jgi:putative ABC transport system permease protein